MKSTVAAVFGTVTTFAAVAVLLVSDGSSPDFLTLAVAIVVAVVGGVGALVKVVGTPDDETVAPAPWHDAGALVERAPERTPADHDLSGKELAGVVEAAGETAREDGTVAAGVESVRPHLREALLDVLVAGGTDRTTAKRSLARGSWTDDDTAAAVVDDAVEHPDRSPLGRFEAWLFPEQVVRQEVRQTMQAIADVANEELPSVPGQHAPRTVPVLEPTLEDLRRGADDRLQRAVDPLRASTRTRVDGDRRVDDGVSAAAEERSAQPAEGPTQTEGHHSERDGETERDGSSTQRRPSPTASLDDVHIGGSADEPDREVSRR